MDKNISLVKQYKDAGQWDGMDASLKAFTEGLDIVLKNIATEKASQSELTEKLAQIEKGLLSAEQKAAFADIEKTTHGMAKEIQKLKDAGLSATEVLPYDQAFVKALKENAEAIKALKGNEKGNVTLSFKAAAIMGSSNVSANTAPMMPGTTMVTGLAEAPRNQPFLIDLVDVGSISTPTIIWFNKKNREDGTAFISEGTVKPLSDFDIVGETQSVKKVATRFNVNEEYLTDIPFIEGEIRTEGVNSLRLAIDEQILSGDNTGSNLKGILEYVSGYVLSDLDDSTPNANPYDAILACNTMLDTLNHQATAAVVHPTTRYRLRTMKDSTGAYIIPPSADKNALNIDGLPVIAKNQITPGKILVGDFKKSHVKVLMDIEVRVGYNGDDFKENRVTFLVESRLMHYIKDVETSAFVYDDLSVIQAALEAQGAE